MVATPRPSQRIDAVHDILGTERQPLDAIFGPKSVAVIGASERAGSVGRTLIWNLISSPFGGTVFPINPKRSSILGIKAYPSMADIHEPVDLAVIATPAPTVPGVIRECIAAGVKGAIIISAGFKEIGESGIALERDILAAARQGQMRIIGPNCLGVMNPHLGLNATFASTTANPGNVAFISQSGALCTSILDWSFQENVGFSAFVSIGSMLDVGWGDLIDYLGDDPHTQSIVIYMETIGDARSFLSAAREVALTKPIIVISAGRTEAAAHAAASHTGSLTGSNEVLSAAFRRCGVLQVDSIEDLFNMAEVLGKQPRPSGNRLTILTNAGGPGVLTTDALICEGGALAELSPDTIDQLNQVLPPQWSHSNPIDILGDADPERYARALEIVAQDPNSDGLLIVLTPQAMTDPTATAIKITEVLEAKPRSLKSQPILASWMGGESVRDGEAMLNKAHIFTFPYPDTAAHVFNYMWRYSYNLQGIYETPVLPKDSTDFTPDRQTVEAILQQAQSEARTLLTEWESKQVLAAYGIPIVETRITHSIEEATAAAANMGYPVVLKLHSTTITHKTDVGGVKLNLKDADAVQIAFQQIQLNVTQKVGPEHFQGVSVQPMIRLDGGYELILGSSVDVQFGPVLLFGTGGQLVEIYQDRALALPPLNSTLATRMMEQTRIYKALKGVRGRESVNLAQLEQICVRFSQLVAEQPRIASIDINPLLATPERILALDARVLLHDSTVSEAELPTLAIRPYPLHYAAPWTTHNNLPVMIRPIRPEDEPLLVQYHELMSEQSIYMRYFHLLKLKQRVAHERLTRICFNDYDREMALVVEYRDPETAVTTILAVGRICKLHGSNDAEFSMLIADPYQNQGIGTELLRRLIQIAQNEKLHRIKAEIMETNQNMQRICEHLGFQLVNQPGSGVVKAVLELT